MAFFNTETTYNVWETKGIAENRNGRNALTEKTEGEKILGTVDASTPVTYLGKQVEGFEGYHAFKVEVNGQEMIIEGHRNHFDSSTPYNVSKIRRREEKAAKAEAKRLADEAAAAAQPASEETPEEAVDTTELEAAVQAAQAELEAETMQDEVETSDSSESDETVEAA